MSIVIILRKYSYKIRTYSYSLIESPYFFNNLNMMSIILKECKIQLKISYINKQIGLKKSNLKV